MSEAVVQLPPDSTGKKIRAIKKTVGENEVYMEGSVPFDEAGVGLFAATGDGRDALIATVGLEGEHTNPERYIHDNHWEPDAEITISVANAAGEQEVGGAVPAGEVRRIREITIRHEGTNATKVTLFDAAAGNIKLSIDVPASTTRVWSSPDGRAIAATLQPVIQTSDITGGHTFVMLSGVEA